MCHIVLHGSTLFQEHIIHILIDKTESSEYPYIII